MAQALQTAIKTKFKHGLVVGKFFPPHAGHLFLIRTAAQFCKKVTVVIDSPDHPLLPIETRKKAILEAAEFSNVSVVIDGKYFSKKKSFDAIFTSGDSVKIKNKSIAIVNIDPKRELFPISSKQIRECTIDHWSSILIGAQSYLCKRFVVIGAESSGKTTLCHDVVQYLQQQKEFLTTPFVPEFGREYTFAKLATEQTWAKRKKRNIPTIDTIEWVEKDFVHIAQVQNRWENEATRRNSPLIICDTDAFATAIWHERYKQTWAKSFDRIIQKLPERALYILVDERDVPFESDEIRNGERFRTWMRERFASEIQSRGFPSVQISGCRDERIKTAIFEIENCLFWNWN